MHKVLNKYHIRKRHLFENVIFVHTFDSEGSRFDIFIYVIKHEYTDSVMYYRHDIIYQASILPSRASITLKEVPPR